MGDGFLGCGDSVWKGRWFTWKMGKRGCMGWQQVMWPQVFHESLSSFGASLDWGGARAGRWHQRARPLEGKAAGNSALARASEPPHATHIPDPSTCCIDPAPVWEAEAPIWSLAQCSYRGGSGRFRLAQGPRAGRGRAAPGNKGPCCFPAPSCGLWGGRGRGAGRRPGFSALAILRLRSILQLPGNVHREASPAFLPLCSQL